MGSTRIRGNKLALTFGTPGTDYWADATSVVLENEEKDSDVVTFEDAAGESGTDRQWFFTISAVQSTATGSFWRYLWESTGEVVPFTYAPHGNETATAEQPHFLGTCKVGPKPSVGGEASRTSEFTFEVRLDVETGPTLDEGGV
ncbi:hypothetical protein [Ornithinimicrobium sp. W1665]|uniref:hypothetical protein n=1 Tax=Ornithinimicrobium sp. W1665 TaxID=3416666 RepID=UPI003CF997BC